MRDQSHGRINGSAAAAFATRCERELNMVSVLRAPKQNARRFQWGSLMRSSFRIRQEPANGKVSATSASGPRDAGSKTA